MEKSEIFSIYIHYPFCLSKCNYCSFYSIIYDEKLYDNYIKYLRLELEYYKNKYDLSKVKTIYIGGGTPSIFHKNLLEINNVITSSISLNNIKEYTVECNPCTINDELIMVLKNIGCNRVSIGIQSFSDRILNICNRKYQTIKVINNALEILEKYNFNNISIDLINGLPKLDYKYELAEIIKIIINFKNIKHISFYDLTIDNNCIFYKNNKIKFPEESLIYKYEIEFKKLIKDYGFLRYEISNYARDNYYSMHNLNYWKYKDYIGLGPAAHSTINNIRHENIPDIFKYIKGFGYKNIIQLNKYQEIEEYILMGFRLIKGINLINFYERFNIDLLDIFNQRINKYLNFIIINKTHIRIKSRGLNILNTILVDFFKELDEKSQKYNLNKLN